MRILILDNYDSFTFNLAQYLEELVARKFDTSKVKKSETKPSRKSREAAAKTSGKILVYKNNEKSIAEIIAEKPSHIVISPGPGTPQNPEDIGICLDVIKKFAGKIPILGVCLGHQAIAYCYGAHIIEAPEIVHGKTSQIAITDFRTKKGSKKSGLFAGIPQKFPAMRYHSLVVEEKTFPKDLRITAYSAGHARSHAGSVADGTYNKSTYNHQSHKSEYRLIMALEHKKFPLYGIQFHPESFATSYGKKILENFLFNTCPRRRT